MEDALVEGGRAQALSDPWDPETEEEAGRDDRDAAEREAEGLEDGSLDPDELDVEPAWWDEGSDDEA